VWGLLQGPITGTAMAEKLLDGKSSCIDLTPFQLSRFDAVADDEMF
jgi:glycine/D-amino acid oxidase-like deaminating enzyme